MFRRWTQFLLVALTLALPRVASAQQLVLPSCIKDGKCTLDDIVRTGAAFANLITQLSAGFFFAAFIYGGARYLFSFGNKSEVDKGKKAITGSAIGMLIVLAAWTIVTYIVGALTGKK